MHDLVDVEPLRGDCKREAVGPPPPTQDGLLAGADQLVASPGLPGAERREPASEQALPALETFGAEQTLRSSP
eukprot:35246-Lingulodinium_polyedra.AAC.1